MAGVSKIAKLAPLVAMTGGMGLCAIAAFLAVSSFSEGGVVIEAGSLSRTTLVQDAAETRAFRIINRTGRRIWLHNAQGWG